MSAIYLIALGAVCAAVLGVLAEAVLSVSRKPRWAVSRPFAGPAWVDRREHALPFVGSERRASSAMPEEQEHSDVERKSA